VNHFAGISLGHSLFLLFAALIAGVLNAVAAGGSFVSFPALLFTGMPPVNANATNTAALWPGTVASTGAYRRQFTRDTWRRLPPLVAGAAAGGVAGALILLRTPQRTFMSLVPWLLLAATLLFMLSERIARWTQARTAGAAGPSRLTLAGGAFFQFCISVYIGYFGAGVGTLILALLALMGMENIHAMNGIKTLLVSVANAVALATFIAARAIFWPHAVLMAVGATAGGYGGAHYAQKMPPRRIRQSIIVVGFSTAAYFFVRR
jgi:uncharacterized membrane protein YfcA